ncbi:Transcription initiation factor TFIID subunit 11 [Zea mays]|uniref:Transcription initiation factor TFIID subunit 11 n=2 Tax=Zea mays TaxID=4577 RepID=A0A3L6DKB1_MAIZE|nr:Transcription initiation factor TFIID subunit 11, mRNA [Zea mays]PWZ08919.1 Transcription initiation factor TFIID subunit 11 [Zea mays]
MKDPFEADVEEQDSPPESPAPPEDEPGAAGPAEDPEDYDGGPPPRQPSAPASHAAGAKAKARVHREQQEDDDEDEDQIEVDLEKLPSSTGDPDKLAKMKFVLEYAFAILSQFTQQQMNRYESFRRSGFQKSNMKRLLASITGSQKISIPTSIVVSGIAKIFVGELIETGKFRIVVLFTLFLWNRICYSVAEFLPFVSVWNQRPIFFFPPHYVTRNLLAEQTLARVVMSERKDSGPIRPCHIREAYRRLKLEGKIPRRSVPRLFR